MIHKLLKIENVGTFVKVEFNTPNWNGEFKKYNAIYADNGCSKTTFTQLLKSCKSMRDAQELEERKTFDSSSAIEVIYINGNKKQCNYSNAKWNYYDDKSDIFDSYYIEDNVYIITLGNYAEPGSYYEIVVGTEAIKTYKDIISLVQRRKRETAKRKNWKACLKEMDSNDDLNILQAKIIASQNLSKEIGKKIKEFEEKQSKEAEEFGQKYLYSINNYLLRLGTDLQITKLNKKATKFVYYIKIGSHDIRSDSTSKSLRHTLSEGEKNCLAFAFFLARLELRDDIEQRSIVFDDPISSLDNNRRGATLNMLTRLAKTCKQFVLLSHDMKFIKDFKSKIVETQVLKIVKTKDSSQIIPFDIERATLTGIFKDIMVLKEFADKGELSNHKPRDVVRCIRPVLEGFIRLKYYLHIDEGEWLGDFIKKIKNSKEGDAFYQQQKNLVDIEDLNDYSKTYHHANPNCLEEPIVSSELQGYCKLLFKVIEKI
ncbi:MAG: AAA family ATPase [Bacteroidaceae bacterium]|nr:AAA family ATPase [Bacteroidaceae bacterium]